MRDPRLAFARGVPILQKRRFCGQRNGSDQLVFTKSVLSGCFH